MLNLQFELYIFNLHRHYYHCFEFNSVSFTDLSTFLYILKSKNKFYKIIKIKPYFKFDNALRKRNILE